MLSLIAAPRRCRRATRRRSWPRSTRSPTDADGSGQTIAIIELGGGFDQADLDAYFSGLGITGPTVTAVGVDGATNVPGGDPNGADGEVLLDIEVAGALAPGADQVVYFAPNTDAGFLDAVSQAAHADPTPVAISISWGQSEDSWTAQARTAMDDAMADAAALGVTVTAAAGDDGSTDRATDGDGARGLPGLQPARTRLRRHQAAGRPGRRVGDQRDGVEQRRRATAPPGVASAASSRLPDLAAGRRRARLGGRRDRARRARRLRGRRPADRLPDPGRRPGHRHRRHQRGVAAVGGAGRPAEPADRTAARSAPARAVRRASARASSRRASATSPTATTAPTRPVPAGTPARASAYPTARRCSPYSTPQGTDPGG